MRGKPGQVLVLVVVFVWVVLLLLALSVEVGRLSEERHRLRGVADAAAKGGMLVVADQMVTLAAARQTQAAESPCVPDAGYGTPGATCTATPRPEVVPAWLTDEDRATLVSPPMRTQVAQAVQTQLNRNGYGTGDLEVEIQYPYHYHPEAEDLRLRLYLRVQLQSLLAHLLGQERFWPVGVESQQELPQRWNP